MAPPLLLLAFYLLMTVATAQAHGTLRHPSNGMKCERISVPFCKDMPYNMTRLPNIVGQETMADASNSLLEYQTLVRTGCSKHLTFFLCSLYTPMCSEQVDVAIPSCRSICEEVRSRCEPFLQGFHIPWPRALNCSQLPVHSKDELCMEFPNITEDRGTPGGMTGFSGGPIPVSGWRNVASDGSRPVMPRKGDVDLAGRVQGSSSNFCPSRFVLVGGYPPYHNACAPACDSDVYFSRSDKRFAEVWMTVWAVLCFVSTAFTTLTFFIDRATFKARFQYPERPIVFLSLCCLVYSCGFLLGVSLGRDVVSCDRNEPNSRPFLILEGLESTGCTVVFLILYYFGNVASIWWVNLTLAWYLTAGCKWRKDSVESLGTYFHIAAWVIPAILTIVVLTMRQVVGDELTGLCFVGGRDSSAMIMFVIVPLGIFLFLGTVFLCLGFAAMVRMRKSIRSGEQDGFKAEKLMVRIGVFAVLYMVPTLILEVTYVYEYKKHKNWESRALLEATACDHRPSCELDKSIPYVEIFMLKIFVSLVIGITSGMWVWSKNTLEAWKRFCCRMGKNHRSKVVLLLTSKPTVSVATTAPNNLAVQKPLLPSNTVADGQRERSHRQSNARATIRTQV
uniref:Frizzled-3 n=1 Tax=Narceus annularis TaxID=174156 RepID=A0A143VP61_NARAN|nr:Frizzled-3 [Glomeris marginata]